MVGPGTAKLPLLEKEGMSLYFVMLLGACTNGSYVTRIQACLKSSLPFQAKPVRIQMRGESLPEIFQLLLTQRYRMDALYLSCF